MKKALSLTLQISLCAVAYLCATASNIQAQVTPDGTVNTIVTPDGNVAEITGGETRDSNLFHSFQEFSVGTGNEAFFNNANDISNILSRVTGGNISNIDGLIRANGSASLFLINPAGIIFGENASLSLGGSFYGSSASSILFENGEFSAADLENPPLLTVNAPIGLGFRDNPGDIVNRSTVNGVGLEVLTGETISLIGGDVNFEEGRALAPGGNIELGGLSQAGIVDLNEDGSFSFPGNMAKADINFVGLASLNVIGTGEGNITLTAQNLNSSVEGFDFVNSFITAGIAANSTSAGAQAGDIVIDVAENITLNSSRIVNEVESGGVGSSGNITIVTGNLTLINGSTLFANTEGIGNAGNVDITATDTITVDGGNVDGSISSIISQVGAEAEGDAGSVRIATGNLKFTNGGSIFANTEGMGDAGNVDIIATDTVTFDGESSGGLPGGIVSVVLPGAKGKSGDLKITTGNLNFTNGARIDNSTEGMGDAGNVDITARETIIFDGETRNTVTPDASGGVILGGVVSSVISEVRAGAEGDGGDVKITTNNLNFRNGGRVSANTEAQGNAGSVDITAFDTIIFDGNSEVFNLASGIASRVGDDAVGVGGTINLTANNLNFTNGGRVDVSTEAQGNAGSVDITAFDTIIFDGESSEDSGSFASGIVSTVGVDAMGDGGSINLTANNLNFTNGGRVDASTEAQGNAGSVDITAFDTIIFDGNTEEFNFPSGIFTNALINNGNGGNVKVITNQLTIENGGTIEVSNFDSISGRNPGTGEPGNITIEANSIDLVNEARIDAATQSETGESGIINLQIVEDITLKNNSFLSAKAFNNANGGNLEIDARFVIAFPSNGTGNDLIATADDGIGGNIILNATQIFGLQIGEAINSENNNLINNNTNDIDASSDVEGLDGTVTINTSDINPVQGATELPQNVVESQQTTAQACQANSEIAAKNVFTIKGKGGIPADPGLPLDSQNISINGETNSTSTIPQPIETSQGKIQPARGIKVTESGEIILTAYRTNNSGDMPNGIASQRLPEGSINCGGV